MITKQLMCKLMRRQQFITLQSMLLGLFARLFIYLQNNSRTIAQIIMKF